MSAPGTERTLSHAEWREKMLRDMYGDPPRGWRRLLWDSRNYLRGWVVGAALAVIAGALIFGLIEGIVQGARAAGRTICHNFGTQSGFKTKMVVLYWADPGTCLAQAPNGQWVLNTKVQQFVGGKP